MTMKLHKPKCSEKCYYVQTAVWTGKFSEDDGQMAVNLISRFGKSFDTLINDQIPLKI